MNYGQNYREYDAWLQKGAAAAMEPVRLTGPKEAAFELAECKNGLIRLFGEDVVQEDAAYALKLMLTDGMPLEAYSLIGTKDAMAITASDKAGLLYGVYDLLARLRRGDERSAIRVSSAPSVKRRVLNHWDNADGTIERGYSGKSIFFKDGKLCYSEKRIKDYARLLASVGINQISINNVNVREQSIQLMTEEMLPEVAAMANLFRPFHIRLILSVHFESPVLLGGLTTADPMDEKVAAWWRDAAQRVYRHIPDFAGFLVKADSEFQGGPASLGRTQADGANVIAKALKPFGGTVYWRCFIYNCMQDWRDTGTDRPKAAYETFMPLDGKFIDNVVLQIKYGPTDFQVREPNSPLLGAMKNTRQAIEFQITQEYTGHQIDLYTLAVQWQEVLSTPVTDTLITSDLMGSKIDTMVAVSNVGDDENWTGHTLSQANLFAFGRMAFNVRLSAREVTKEWVEQTFGTHPLMVSTLVEMLLSSREVYEKYNAPLGIGWMVVPNGHYGPSVDGYEYSKWGTYHRANHQAIGVDRTSKGTGLTSQYHPALAALYDSLDSCPQELLLFFHRLKYTYVLKSGKTLIQHIYDTHFEGVQNVQGYIKTWDSLKELLPPPAYSSVQQRLFQQLENAVEWRDVVNTYFYRLTGIPDEKGRLIYP